MDLLIKQGSELTVTETLQVQSAHIHEFRGSRKIRNTDIFFLLMKNELLIALGGLLPIEPVIIGKSYSIRGIGGIIANVKRRGYGTQIISAIRRYLLDHQLIGVGFCREQHKTFYTKSGFIVNKSLLKKFVYLNNNKKITNKTEDYVILFDPTNIFTKTIKNHPDQDIVLPRSPDW